MSRGGVLFVLAAFITGCTIAWFTKAGEREEFERAKAELHEHCEFVGQRYEIGWGGGPLYLWQCDGYIFETPEDYR